LSKLDFASLEFRVVASSYSTTGLCGMRSRKSCKENSLTLTIVFLAVPVGLMTSGCAGSIDSITPQVQAGPSASLMYAQSLSVPELKAEEIVKSTLPFIGTQSLELSDGTRGTITIASNGTATLKIESEEYLGNFSKPELPEEDQASLVEGMIASGCMSEDGTCESMLREVTHQTAKLAPDDNFVSSDDRFIYQDFNPDFFQQVLEINQACKFTPAAPCSSHTYTFRDSNLTTKNDGKESTEYTLTFAQPVTGEAALSYLSILTQGEEVSAPSETNRMALQSCSESAVLCEAEFLTNSIGEISGVKLIELNPEQSEQESSAY
jgi:hypothetical protein